MELSEDEWRRLVLALAPDEASTIVETFLDVFEGTYSRPALVTCSDEEQHVIKGLNSGRVPYNEQVVAHLGQLLDAPIPTVTIAELPAELQEAEPALGHILAGPVHASRFEPGVADRVGAEYLDEPENRERAAALTLLYTWVRAWDVQLLYKKQSPRLLFSIDHSHFFPGGPDWTIQFLQQAPPISRLDPAFLTITRYRTGILEQAFSRLEQITPELIVQAVARPPESWYVPLTDRVALCQYLGGRHGQVLHLRRP